jgi:hypothetical protein
LYCSSGFGRQQMIAGWGISGSATKKFTYIS